MGTSNAYGGPGGRTPLIPSWLGGSEGEASLNGPNSNLPGTIPLGSSPPVPPIPSPAAADRFTAARGNFSRFARSGGSDTPSLGRAVSNYVSSGTGGSRGAAQRMGASRATGYKLLGFLSNAVANGARAALRALKLDNLAGRPIEEVFLGLMDYICPDGGTVDEGIAREAFIETIGELVENGITSVDGLTIDQMQIIFELYASHSIEARLCNDIGTKAITLPANISAADRVQAQLSDFVRRGVADALAVARSAMEDLTPERVRRFVTDLYEQAFVILQKLGEAEGEAT